MSPPISQQQTQPSQSVIMFGVTWLARLFSFLLAFFLTPMVFGLTVGPVQSFTAQFYAAGFVTIVNVVWFICCFLIVFLITLPTLGTAFITGAMAFARRVL